MSRQAFTRIKEISMAIAPEAKRDSDGPDGGQKESGNNNRTRAFGDRAQRDVRTAEDREDAAAQTAETMATTRHMLSQGQEAIRGSLRSMAAANEPLISAGYDQGRRIVEATLRINDTYRDAAERTVNETQALTEAQANLGRGLQQWQHACFDLWHRAFDTMVRRQQEMLRCNSLAAVAEIQRDLYVDAVSNAFTSSTTLLQISAQTAQDALRPLQERVRSNVRT
jgi:Phasin protein